MKTTTRDYWTTYFIHNATGLLTLSHTMPPDYLLCITPPDYLLCITQCHRTTYFVLHHRTTYLVSQNATELLTLYHTTPLDYLLGITQCHWTTCFVSHNATGRLTLCHNFKPVDHGKFNLIFEFIAGKAWLS